jgi:hypothetical protein
MGSERSGGWVNGMHAIQRAPSHPVNAPSTNWYQGHDSSTLGSSFQEHEKERQRQIAVYQVHQNRHTQPNIDLMTMWAPIHGSLAHSGFNATEAFRRQGLEIHSAQVLRPDLVYSDRGGEQQHQAAKQMLGLGGFETWLRSVGI